MGKFLTLKTISHGSEEKSMYSHIGGILRYDYVLGNLKKYSNRGGKFLDIGCGQGAYVIEASKLFNRIVGLDISPANIKFCKKRLRESKMRNCTFLVGNVTKLPFPNEKFSVISISEVLEHLSPSQINYTLREAKRVLCTEGILLITVPSIFLDYKANKENVYRNILLSFKQVVPYKRNILERRSNRKGVFHNFFTKKEIENIVSSSGFKVLKLCHIVKWPVIVGIFIPTPTKNLLSIFFNNPIRDFKESDNVLSLPDPTKITKIHKFFELLPFLGNHIFISAINK